LHAWHFPRKFFFFQGQPPAESLDNIENELMRSRAVSDELDLVEQALVDDLFDDTLARQEDSVESNSSTSAANSPSIRYERVTAKLKGLI
jgi:hypothetical protein